MTARSRKARVRPARNVKKRATGVQTQSGKSGLSRRVLPLVVSAGAVLGLFAISFAFYTNAANSGFFDLRSVEIRGARRAPVEEIEKIIRANAGKTGVWNADLLELKQKIEKVPFVKYAAVARRLPGGIVVSLDEREPVAVVRLGENNFLVDGDGQILAPAENSEPQFPFVMLGWDTEKSDRAARENAERLKIYEKMLADWRDYDLAIRVKSVDLSNLREPRANLEDSGYPVSIMVGRDNFGRRLSDGIKAIVGKGEIFEGVELMGPNMKLVERRQKR
jgi:cell division protein FtsQ